MIARSLFAPLLDHTRLHIPGKHFGAGLERLELGCDASRRVRHPGALCTYQSAHRLTNDRPPLGRIAATYVTQVDLVVLSSECGTR